MGTTMLHAEKQNALIMRPSSVTTSSSDGPLKGSRTKLAARSVGWRNDTQPLVRSMCQVVFWKSPWTLESEAAEKVLASVLVLHAWPKILEAAEVVAGIFDKHHEWSRALSRPRPDVFKLLCR